MANKTALIIGSGIAGLAASIRLRNLGLKVKVFEASDTIGGKMGELQQDGFRWDTGPSLFTMPQFLEELFIDSNRDMSDYIPYQREKEICHYFWEDGSRFCMSSDLENSYREMSDLFAESEERIKAYFDKSLEKYQLTAPIFLESSLHKRSTYFKKETVNALVKSHRLDLFENLHDLNRKWFSNEKLVQLLDRFATYNGSSPYQCSGIMSMIPSLEMHYGTFFPKKGMRSIANGLYELANELGVEFHLEEEVEEIQVKGGKARGIKTLKGEYNADTVVCNMDVFFAYDKLLQKVKKPKSLSKSERSSSAIIFYWGIDRTFKELGLHNILFSDDYESEFDHIFNKGSISDDPTIYINISSKSKSDDAPEGMENWFVMINAPANQKQDWAEIKSKAKVQIINKLNRVLNVDIEPMIKTENSLDPIRIEEKTLSHGGSLYGTSSNSMQSAFLRHPNFSNSIKDLFFLGGSVHPGGGIPLCLQSAKIVSQLISS